MQIKNPLPVVWQRVKSLPISDERSITRRGPSTHRGTTSATSKMSGSAVA